MKVFNTNYLKWQMLKDIINLRKKLQQLKLKQ